MDHHIKCVARVLERISGQHDLRTEKIMLSWLQAAILDEGFISRIEKLPMPPNAARLQGLFYRKTWNDGHTEREMAVINYDATLPDENEARYRLVIAKELSHIFDEPGERTATAVQIDELLSGLISEKVRADPTVRADENARLLAVEMLVPYERRKLLLRKPVTGLLVQTLAVECGIPLEYARIALDVDHNAIIKAMREKCGIKDLYPDK